MSAVVTYTGDPLFAKGLDLVQETEGARIGKLGACQAGRIGNDRQHIGAQCLMCGPGEVSGIHPAGIGDENAAQSM